MWWGEEREAQTTGALVQKDTVESDPSGTLLPSIRAHVAPLSNPISSLTSLFTPPLPNLSFLGGHTFSFLGSY